jgi:hypothetical protein
VPALSSESGFARNANNLQSAKMPEIINISALSAGRWEIEAGGIPCDRGRRAQIRPFGGTGDLVLAAESLPDEVESWLRGRPWASELRNRGTGVAFTFGPDRVGEVARLCGARAASRRAAG